MCAIHYLAVKPRDEVPVKTHKLTLAHHRVSSDRNVLKCETCVWGDKKINRLARRLVPRDAILKTEEALGRREHVVCGHFCLNAYSKIW